MRVKVVLAGHLREFFPGLAEGKELVLEQPATVAEVLAEIGVAAELPSAVIVNRQRVDRNYVLADGDELLLLSPMAGG